MCFTILGMTRQVESHTNAEFLKSVVESKPLVMRNGHELCASKWSQMGGLRPFNMKIA